MITLRRLWLLFLLLTLAVHGAFAGLQRAAMVTETKGALSGAGQPLRTLQVLAEGVEAEVPAGGKMRLVYLVSGQKESVTGPCRVRIGSAGSSRLSGTGQVVGEQSGGVKTKLQKSENLRRMGGSLQASANDPAENLLAMFEVEPETDSPKPRSLELSGTLHLVHCPPVARAASAYQTFQWEGGTSPFRVSLRCEGEELERVKLSERTLSFVERRYIPGKVYQLEILGDIPGERVKHDFMVLLPSEQKALDDEVSSFAEALGDQSHDRFVAQLAFQEEYGLLLDVLATCRQAIEAFPEDSGFQATLGRAHLNLGEYEPAYQALLKAKELEGH